MLSGIRDLELLDRLKQRPQRCNRAKPHRRVLATDPAHELERFCARHTCQDTLTPCILSSELDEPTQSVTETDFKDAEWNPGRDTLTFHFNSCDLLVQRTPERRSPR